MDAGTRHAQPIRFWDRYPDPATADAEWRVAAERLAAERPLRVPPNVLRPLPGIRESTRRRLRWKALRYLLQHDEHHAFPRHVLRHPLRYGWRLARSYLSRTPYRRDGDLFLYGVRDVAGFRQLLADPDSLLVFGFSYCHKPFECPSGRFTDACAHDADNPVCRQCLIGRWTHMAPAARTRVLYIPTVHYIGERMLELVHDHPGRRVLFIITACELTLEMFADWGNMIDIRGIGVRLDGQICNTMRAFEASEAGIKPGLTVVLDDTVRRIDELVLWRRSCERQAAAGRGEAPSQPADQTTTA